MSGSVLELYYGYFFLPYRRSRGTVGHTIDRQVARNGKSVLQLKVNFSKDIIVLHKEVR